MIDFADAKVRCGIEALRCCQLTGVPESSDAGRLSTGISSRGGEASAGLGRPAMEYYVPS